MWVLSLSLACHKSVEPEGEPVPAPVTAQTEPAPAPAPAPAPLAPVSEQDVSTLVRALSQRDGAPACAQVEALVSQPVPALLVVVDTVQMPPMAPMRAASCLMDSHVNEPSVVNAVVAWMNEPETLGLALLVAERVDSLPPELAQQAVTAGLAGPHAVKLRERLSQSQKPEIRALLGL